MLRQLSTFFVPSVTSRTKSEQSLQTEATSTVSGESSKSLSLSVRNKASKKRNLDNHKQHATKNPVQQDLANRILNRLKTFPDISEGVSDNELPDPTSSLAALANHFPAQDLDHKAVTPDQLSAYFTASSGQQYDRQSERESDIAVRERIPHRQHPFLQPPKCVANLAVYTYASTSVDLMCGGTVEASNVVSAGAGLSTVNSVGCSMNVEETEFPRFTAQAKPGCKPLIPLLNLSFVENVAYDTTFNIIEQPASKSQPSLLGMLLRGGSRIAVAPA